MNYRVRVKVPEAKRRETRTIHAVHGVSFQIDDGEIVGYVGLNGAGKTTTMKLMSGILKPTAGTVRVFGLDPFRARSQVVKQLGIRFGNRSQLVYVLPVIDSLKLYRDVFEVSMSRFERNLDRLSDTLMIRDLLGIPARQLSLGQRMRCELAASMIHDPKFLILDEPFIGDDFVGKGDRKRLLASLRLSLGISIILSSHNLSDIEDLCDRVIVLHQGRVLYNGSIDALRETEQGMTIAFHTIHDRHTLAAKIQDVPGASLRVFDSGHVEIDVMMNSKAVDVISLFDSDSLVSSLEVRRPTLERMLGRLYESGTMQEISD